MKGQILTYDPLKAEGIVSGEDGNRYPFTGSDWRATAAQLRSGAHVDFSPSGGRASDVFLTPGLSPPPSPLTQPAYASSRREDKSPVAAGLFAIFLGGLGVHRFYLGYTNQGIILLAATILSWLTAIILIGLLGLMVISVICLVEGIIYLTKNPDEFQDIYVDNKRPWF